MNGVNKAVGLHIEPPCRLDKLRQRDIGYNNLRCRDICIDTKYTHFLTLKIEYLVFIYRLFALITLWEFGVNPECFFKGSLLFSLENLVEALFPVVRVKLAVIHLSVTELEVERHLPRESQLNLQNRIPRPVGLVILVRIVFGQ